MLIGHLPAGYLATAALTRSGGRRLLALGLACSVAPDLDLLYFYGVDSGLHHHAFPTHWPVTWLAVGLIVGLAWRPIAGLVAGGNGLLHLGLDTIAGEVRWLAPVSEWPLTLVAVPTRFESWVLSFLTHWTFGVEVAIAVAAGVVWWRRRGSRAGDREGVGQVAHESSEAGDPGAGSRVEAPPRLPPA